MSVYRSAWRERVADPNYLVMCVCSHAEQNHDRHGCRVTKCICDALTEARREWVGPANEKPT